jgi:hypothetical protein
MAIGGIISGLIFLLIFGAAWAAWGGLGAVLFFGAVGLGLMYLGRREQKSKRPRAA